MEKKKRLDFENLKEEETELILKRKKKTEEPELEDWTEDD